MSACMPGWFVPLPSALSTGSRRASIALRVHGKLGEYSAATSRAARLSADERDDVVLVAAQEVLDLPRGVRHLLVHGGEVAALVVHRVQRDRRVGERVQQVGRDVAVQPGNRSEVLDVLGEGRQLRVEAPSGSRRRWRGSGRSARRGPPAPCETAVSVVASFCGWTALSSGSRLSKTRSSSIALAERSCSIRVARDQVASPSHRPEWTAGRTARRTASSARAARRRCAAACPPCPAPGQARSRRPAASPGRRGSRRRAPRGP